MVDDRTTPEGASALSRSALMRRGWSNRQIIELLGQPDATAPNPRLPDGPPMRLYRLTRVEAIEASAAFDKVAAERRARRDS